MLYTSHLTVIFRIIRHLSTFLLNPLISKYFLTFFRPFGIISHSQNHLQSLVLLVLLLVPALNLSGMISSRMEGRLAEMGVRKSFGAGRKILLSQVMWENLLLTALGGALGLLLAWLALYVGREWIFTVFDSWPNMVPEGVEVRVSGEMLFAPLVFLAALALCVVLNLLSALIPSWYSLRKPIVNSLNEKR